ncbi:MAG: heavy metal translocating P-type ATPase, partial [Pseudomonadota bacterium]
MLFSGRPFFRSAITALSNGHTNMDVPITVGVFLTGGMSLFQAYHHAEHAYFDSGVMLLFFLLIGRYFDFRARTNARSTATDLLSTFSGFANVLENNAVKRILIRDVKEDMLVRVGMGDKFPVDGTIIEGHSDVDTSLVTGETIPRKADIGDSVFAGTLNLSAPVTMRVAKAAENSLLADIVRLMEKAGQGQAHYVRLADKAAKLYTPIVHILAILAFFGWWLGVGEPWEVSLMIATTVLIITCPCAMGLAVPVVQVLATSRLMKHKILVKSGDALERLSSIDTILLDKTGTLTLGTPTLTSSSSMEDLQMAASLAHSSSHPLSKAIVASFQGEFVPIEHVQEFAGQGLEGIYNGKRIRLGSRAFCGDSHAPSTDSLEIWLSIEDTAPTLFTFSDVLRGDAKDIVRDFQNCGLRVIILSGDREHVVAPLAKELGITEYYAQLTPPQKYAKLEDIKQ